MPTGVFFFGVDGFGRGRDVVTTFVFLWGQARGGPTTKKKQDGGCRGEKASSYAKKPACATLAGAALL